MLLLERETKQCNFDFKIDDPDELDFEEIHDLMKEETRKGMIEIKSQLD